MPKPKGAEVHVLIHVHMKGNRIIGKRCSYWAEGREVQEYPNPYIAVDDIHNMQVSAESAPLLFADTTEETEQENSI